MNEFDPGRKFVANQIGENGGVSRKGDILSPGTARSLTGQEQALRPEANKKQKRRIFRAEFSDLPVQEKDKYLPPRLERAIDHIIDDWEEYNSRLPKDIQRPEGDFFFLGDFYKSFIIDRNRRAEEVATPEYQDIAKSAVEMIPMKPFGVICMDGRVKLVHINGFTADIGDSLRTPAGLLNEFVREDETLVLDPDSNFSMLILNALRKNGDNLSEVFDSHWSCKAREGEEVATGNHPGDKGLLRDVVHKKEMVKATKDFLKDKKETKGKNIAFIQTTFNPITGYMYMGLERDSSLEYAKSYARKRAIANGENPNLEEQYAEYTKNVLRDLILRGEIISTGAIIQETAIQEAFQSHFFEINRQKDYVRSAKNFWEGIKDMKDNLMPILVAKIIKLYPHLEDNSPLSIKEREQRAMLLLTNAYNAFLHNPDHDEDIYLNMDDEEYEVQEKYKYGVHDEEGVKISEGGHPPYTIPMFVIYGSDLVNLPRWTEKASGIVRDNRTKGRVTDPTGFYTYPKAFARGIVPVVAQEIVRNTEEVTISDTQWKVLMGISWSDMPKGWDKMSDEEFRKFLYKKGLDSSLLIDAVQAGRNKLAKLYDPAEESSSHLKDMYKAAVVFISNKDRKSDVAIPFIKV